MASGITCLVTIHGIGFQQAPDGDLPGYADFLHDNLTDKLTSAVLSGDPGRDGTGAVYVQSQVLVGGKGSIEEGLRRLGSWDDSETTIDFSKAPLVTGDQPIAHVALVYSHLEEETPKLGSLFEMGSQAAVHLGHYVSITAGTQMLFRDGLAMIETMGNQAPTGSGLMVRRDIVGAQQHHLVPGFIRRKPNGSKHASGLLATLRQLENDVAAYVSRNDLRERVRAFVREALLRLAARKDVSAIVVNGHSQGTVIAFDVLSDLPPGVGDNIKTIVSAGSPLRKYLDLFCWGREVGCIEQTPWLNFWDPTDPVADDLAPFISQRMNGRQVAPSGETALFRWTDPDTGDVVPVAIRDVQIDNIHNSGGGGLQAHNYWGNKKEFIEPLGTLLAMLAGVPITPQLTKVTP